MSDDTLLTLSGIKKSFDGTPVLRGLDLAVARGEFLTLLGPSGCGKTTTLRIIAGLETPDAGTVSLAGADVTCLPPEKRNVNTVFQNYALFPHMNVERNIAYGLSLRRTPRAEIKRRVKEMLELVQLPEYARRMPSQLSGGQRQRVAIARAVILNPDVLLLDEPLGALDLKLRRQMQTELKSLQQRLGITFIYITHDQEEALNMSNRIAIMQDGAFEQIGTPEEVYERPATRFVAGFIGQGSLFEGRIEAIDGDRAQVALAGGRAMARFDGGLKVGDAVAISVHAERIQYAAQPCEGFSLPATIAAHRYAGSTLRTELQTDWGQMVQTHSLTALSALPPTGTRVHLCWPAQYGALIAGEAVR